MCEIDTSNYQVEQIFP